MPHNIHTRDQFPPSTRTPEALAKSKPKESAMAELRRILHAEDECHPGLTCADEIMEQHDAMLAALKDLWGYVQDLQESNPGYLGKLCLQDYARFNRAMGSAPAAIAKAEGRS